ncbi:MAG: hypothetical protein JWO64_2154, partial [Hyphomicrobiales bacterium]|nr:hypothetical protein [Hyphomicrobiales bacterium]
TALIAAMRAYVASKYGDEVPNIPEQLPSTSCLRAVFLFFGTS